MKVTARRIVFVLVLATFAFFVQGAGANQSSRYALVRALVENHELAIDRFADTTFDRSTVGVASYSDKAPGLSLVAAIPYALGVRLLQPREQVAPDPLALHVLTLLTVGLATAFAAVLLLGLLGELGVGEPAALIAVAGWILGTNVLAYGGMFYAHQLVAALLVIAIAAIHAAARGAPRAMVLGAGVALGLATISEYPCALLAGGVLAYAVVVLGPRRCVPLVLGGLVPGIVLAIYNTACFGAPWRLGYGTLATPGFAEKMSHGMMGITWPDPRVVVELVAREYRGMLPLSPFLVLAAPGLVWLIQRRRALGVLCAASFVGYVLLISGYAVWDGGDALGPRHLIPVLPYAVIGVAVAIDRMRGGRVIGGVLVAVSIAICTVCASVRPELPDAELHAPPVEGIEIPDYRHPITQIAFPLFVRGELGVKAQFRGYIGWVGQQTRADHTGDAYNLGEVLGLSGVATLIPLLVLWAVGGVLLARRRRMV
jgi:hypothetical protein